MYTSIETTKIIMAAQTYSDLFKKSISMPIMVVIADKNIVQSGLKPNAVPRE